jgi:hypothetical protein
MRDTADWMGAGDSMANGEWRIQNEEVGDPEFDIRHSPFAIESR